MKIKEIRDVSIDIPRPSAKTQPRRPNWNTHAPRALPINKYPEFSRLHGRMPGANTNADVWVRVTAEDDTWGLGLCSFGSLWRRSSIITSVPCSKAGTAWP